MNNLSDDDDDDDDDTCPNLAYESDDDEDYTDKKIRRKSKPKKKKKKVKKDVKPPLLTETEIEQQLGKLNVIEQGGEINFINIYDASYLFTDLFVEFLNVFSLQCVLYVLVVVCYIPLLIWLHA
jgi:hypothetical protein